MKIRTIDLASPSGDLLADSKVVFSSVNHGCATTLELTADGKTVVCGTFASGSAGAKKSSAYDPEILEYSVATGQSRLVYRLNGACNCGYGQRPVDERRRVHAHRLSVQPDL